VSFGIVMVMRIAVPPYLWIILNYIYIYIYHSIRVTYINIVKFGAIIMVNKGFLNTNTAITRQLMGTARTLKAEGRQVLRGSVSTG
jgi:hypothetical protein